jgi:phage-related protein
MSGPSLKFLSWIGSSHEDLKSLPDPVQDTFGYALYVAQKGEMPDQTKPLRGFRGAGVLEIIENYDTDTYRAVYTVRFREILYVLHVFQKKSKRGVETSGRDLDLIRSRLKSAEEDYQRWKKEIRGE